MEIRDFIINYQKQNVCTLYVRYGRVYSVDDTLISKEFPFNVPELIDYLQFSQDHSAEWNYISVAEYNPIVKAALLCHEKNNWELFDNAVNCYRLEFSTANLLDHEADLIYRSQCIISDSFKICESVLEKTFLAHFLGKYGSLFRNFYHDRYRSDTFMMEQQVEVGNYRVDFMFTKFPSQSKVIVELDGHQFHSDRKALIRDKSRDRTLQKLGFQIFRFTYEEMYGNPKKHIDALFEYINDGK